jgi:hypothetical protein
MVHAAGAAEADLAEPVDVILADPVVRIAALSGWGGLDGGDIGLGWGGAVERTMGPDLVVDVCEGVELGLQLGDGGGGWLCGEPALQSLVEAFDLALGWGWPGWPFFCATPRLASRYSKPLRPPVKREV